MCFCARNPIHTHTCARIYKIYIHKYICIRVRAHVHPLLIPISRISPLFSSYNFVLKKTHLDKPLHQGQALAVEALVLAEGAGAREALEAPLLEDVHPRAAVDVAGRADDLGLRRQGAEQPVRRLEGFQVLAVHEDLVEAGDEGGASVGGEKRGKGGSVLVE